MRVLIIRTSALGDVVHCLPVLAALRRAFPEARIGWVVERAMAPLLEGHSDLDELLVVELRAWRKRPLAPRTLAAVARFLGRLVAFSPDVALDLMGNHKGGMLAALSLADRRLGLSRRHRREPSSAVWISEPVEPRGIHAVDRALSIAAALLESRSQTAKPAAPAESRGAAPGFSHLSEKGGTTGGSTTGGTSGGFSHLSEEGGTSRTSRRRGAGGAARESAMATTPAATPPGSAAFDGHKLFAADSAGSDAASRPTAGTGPDHPDGALGLEALDGFPPPRRGRRPLLIHPGAGWGNKRYPPAWWGRAGAIAAERLGLPLGVLSGPGEEGLAAEVVAHSEGRAELIEAVGLAALTARLREAALVLAGDTGPLHLAHAVGTPVLCLMGPTDPERNGPYGAPESALYHRLPCSFCHRRFDDAKACLLEISPERVASRAVELLAGRPRHAC